MKCSMETWDSEDHPKTRTLYYCGMSEGGSTDKVFYSPTFTEDLEHVSPRTLEAFEEAINLDWKWDFIARPNSSCYVHKKNLVSFVDDADRKNAIYGILTGGEESFLWGGCQFIFSRDVIERFVAYRRKWNNNVMEDNAITLLARELKIPLESKGWCASINLQGNGEHVCLTYNHGESFTFSDWEDVNKLDGHFFVRCKYDSDRTQDLMTFRKLFQHWK